MRTLRCALFACLLSAACGSSAVPEPRASDVSRGGARFPGLTLAELEHGRSLYLSRCSGCHVLKRPSELAPEQWQAEVSEMRSKNGVKLSEPEAQAIVRYLALASTSQR